MEDMNHAETAGFTPREHKKSCKAMLVTIGESLTDLARSDDGEDGEDENEEIEQGILREDDEPGRVMGTITKIVQQRMSRFWQKQMKLNQFTQPGWEDVAGYFPERDKKYVTSQLRNPAIIQPQMNDNIPASQLTTFGKLMECLHIVPGISQMPQGTSHPGSCLARLGLVILQSYMSMLCPEPAGEPELSPVLKAKTVKPVSFYHSI
jgi:hypothetical protein